MPTSVIKSSLDVVPNLRGAFEAVDGALGRVCRGSSRLDGKIHGEIHPKNMIYSHRKLYIAGLVNVYKKRTGKPPCWYNIYE